MAKSGSAGIELGLSLNRNSTRPLHDQIASGLRQAMAQGRMHYGARLPSTRVLARDWQVSRNTVLHVFETLTSEGLLESRVGDGTYISEPSKRSDAGGAVVSELASAGQPVGFAGTNNSANKACSRFFRRLSQRGQNLIAQGQSGLSEKPAPFMPDAPDVREFPMRNWLRLMNEVSGRLTGDILVNMTNAGYEPLREAIAQHLRMSRHVECSAEQVIVTTGSQQSIDLCSRLLLDKGDPVWVEEPGYMGARAALAANRCSLYPIAADKDGMNILNGCLQYPAPRMIVVSPSRHYPLGGRLNDARRNALIAFSDKSGAWILEDDYDSEFGYAGGYSPAIKSIDRHDRVIMIGTFSKTLLPSFRLGFIVVPPDLVDDFARARAVVDRHAPILEQMVLAEFMHRGQYAAHVRKMRALYRERQQALVEVLRAGLAYEPNSEELSSGMHLVLPLAKACDDREVVAQLWQDGIVARPLSIYYAGRERRQGLLLGFGAYRPEEIVQAGQLLSGALGEFICRD
jgi:GntR family transcriptional regulator/MocR family aminotransferase